MLFNLNLFQAIEARRGLETLFSEWCRATDVGRSFYLSQVHRCAENDAIMVKIS